MKIEKRDNDSDLHVTEDIELHGRVGGTVTVASACKLDLRGFIGGSLVIVNGTVYLRGSVAGDVINKGGDLHVHGTVFGKLERLGGRTEVAPAAVIVKA